MWVKIAYPTGDVTVDAQGRKQAAKHKQKRVVLSAVGVWPDGHWEMVSWHVAEQENVEAWETFFAHLYTKGVTDKITQLVISDGAKGLARALEREIYGVPHQRCIFHKIKNLTDHVQCGDLVLEPALPTAEALRKAKQARTKALLADASQVCASDVEVEIRARAAVFRTKWEACEPQAVANFFTDFDKTLCYLKVDLPRSCVLLIRTTNLLERFHKEGRRKQRDIGMLQSERGCEVLWYLLAMRETAKQRAALQSRR